MIGTSQEVLAFPRVWLIRWGDGRYWRCANGSAGATSGLLDMRSTSGLLGAWLVRGSVRGMYHMVGPYSGKDRACRATRTPKDHPDDQSCSGACSNDEGQQAGWLPLGSPPAASVSSYAAHTAFDVCSDECLPHLHHQWERRELCFLAVGGRKLLGPWLLAHDGLTSQLLIVSSFP